LILRQAKEIGEHASGLCELIAYFGECDRSFRRIVTDGLRGDFSAVSVT
jgi:hypothetical protein